MFNAFKHQGRRWLARALAAGLLCTPALAQADGLQALQDFVAQAHTGRAAFEQTVTTPASQGQPERVRRSSGQFVFERPGRFRFDYERPFVQHIVADGQTLWLHDVDLEQVTRQPQEQALGQTPAALIAAASDLQALRAEFELEAEPPADNGWQWVLARPRSDAGMLRQVRVGFDGPRLAALEILDGLGQRSQLRFDQLELNLELAPDTFVFEPPTGADVLQP